MPVGKLARALAVAGAVIAAVPAGPVRAQQAATLAVSPPTFDVQAGGAGPVVRTVRLENQSDHAVDVSVRVTNFTASGEAGEPALTTAGTPYALSSWLTVSPLRARLAAKASRPFELRVAVPAGTPAGGRYGAIVFRSEGVEGSGTSVNVAQEVASLVLVTVPGAVVRELRVESLRVDKRSFQFGPVEVEARLRNTGNVHVEPTTTITVTNLFGREVATLEPRGGNVLPSSVRAFRATWPRKWLWIRYTATLRTSYPGGQPVVAETTFYAFPLALLVVPLLLGLLVAGRRRIRRALRALVTSG